ncbi:MAG: hypothetical protein IPI46_14335 [Bacteroidetes bacterium]|nr:hypothetical protein [Bacteroidota bacterium]
MEKNKNILGISYSTRLIGLAVLSSNHLVDYSVKLYKEKWSPAKCEKIKQTLQSCVEDYNIEEIVLSIPAQFSQIPAFGEINECINSFAKDKGIPISYQNRKMIMTLCLDKEKKNKQGFMRSLVFFFPELARYYEKERRNRKMYYVKVFEAIGFALLQSQVNKTRRQQGKG